jgi:hypothetical protein
LNQKRHFFFAEFFGENILKIGPRRKNTISPLPHHSNVEVPVEALAREAAGEKMRHEDRISVVKSSLLRNR